MRIARQTRRNIDLTALPPWVKPAAGIACATLVAIGWALFVRGTRTDAPLSFESFGELAYNPYFFGLAAQEVLLPLVLLFLFSRSSLFRRLVHQPPGLPDGLKLFGVLAAIQVLFFVYRYGLFTLTGDIVYFGFFLVLAAGLLGGWPVGLAMGAVTMTAVGGLNYAIWSEWEPVRWVEFFEYGVLKNMEAVAALWVGVTAGFGGMLLQERRFQPLIGGALAAAAETAVFLFLFLATDDPWYYVEILLSNLVISGVAMIAFTLMVKGVRDEETQRQAEAAQLELAQANLTLTQTKLALTQAELRALHAQINPHFFFNTLNTIRYFVRTDPDTARDLLVRLSEIFQRALSAGEFVPLRDELSYVEAYLALEQARLDERLRVIWTNLAKNCLETPVPTLVLQPIVENSVIHGLSTQPEGGTLHIVINRVGDDLLFQVDDDGAGFDPTPHLWSNGDAEGERPSLGLYNVDERLRMLYGDAYRLQVESQTGQGTRVIFKIPVND